MEGYVHEHQFISHQQQHNIPSVFPEIGSEELGGVNAALPQHIDLDFFPYEWSIEETRDFLMEEEETPIIHLDENKKRKLNENTNNVGSSENIVGSLTEMFDQLMKKQMELQMQWVKDNENKEEERRKKEIEWRGKMEALGKEKLMMEKGWREREEQWRIKQQKRDEKIDALIDVFVNKRRREEDTSKKNMNYHVSK